MMRTAITGSLPVHKHVVGDVDGAPREGDAPVQRQVQNTSITCSVREADMQCPTDVAAQGAFPAQRREAGSSCTGRGWAG